MKDKKDQSFKIPVEVSYISDSLKKAGFRAYLVGGCTRDLILSKKPKDWDITTDAKPEKILAIFNERSFYENKYGTVGVLNEKSTDQSLKIVEITTFRLESTYSDKRRPDSVDFSKKVEDDLKRRDFTINAIAIDIEKDKNDEDLHKGHIVDLYKGQEDLRHGIIRAVGDPDERFGEDALRMLRAVRLGTELNFEIEQKTLEGIKRNANLLSHIAAERIRDEFIKIIMSENPMKGLILSHNTGILGYVSKDLEKSFGVTQNKAHTYDVFEHLLRSLQHAAKKKFDLEVRLAALFHDIGKPRSRRWSEKKKDWTFHGHEVIGERMVRKILDNLRFPQKITDAVTKLVRWHMFFSDTEQISLSAVRRMVANVGKEQIWELMKVRICDRIGTGRPKEDPYRLRKYKSLIEQVMSDPISVSMLKIKGGEVMKAGNIEAGPKIGHILHALLEEVIEDPTKNDKKYLEKRVIQLSKLTDEKLRGAGEEGKKIRKVKEDEKIKTIRRKYFVE